MNEVINLTEARFNRLNAGKIVKACDQLDKLVEDLVFKDNVPPDEVLAALCQRIGVYLSCTDANIEDAVKLLSSIIKEHATG